MIQEGQVVLFRFPQTNLQTGKLRPALVIRQCLSQYDDWLICMISSQTAQITSDIDELIKPEDTDFSLSGLKKPSVIRSARLAVIQGEILLGTIGSIRNQRLERIRSNLAKWILGHS